MVDPVFLYQLQRAPSIKLGHNHQRAARTQCWPPSCYRGVRIQRSGYQRDGIRGNTQTHQTDGQGLAGTMAVDNTLGGACGSGAIDDIKLSITGQLNIRHGVRLRSKPAV